MQTDSGIRGSGQVQETGRRRAALQINDLEEGGMIGRGFRARMPKRGTVIIATGLWLVGFASQP